MSKVICDTLQALTGGSFSPVKDIVNSVKVWVNFNGTGTVAIRASYNVSSITDNAVGDYTINFTNALPDTNYAITSSAHRDSDSRCGIREDIMYTTSFKLFNYQYNSNTARDDAVLCVAVFR